MRVFEGAQKTQITQHSKLSVTFSPHTENVEQKGRVTQRVNIITGAKARGLFSVTYCNYFLF